MSKLPELDSPSGGSKALQGRVTLDLFSIRFKKILSMNLDFP